MSKDGGISLTEFLKWRNSGGKTDDIRLFRSYDVNADGQLTVSEFVPLVDKLSRTPASEGERVFKLLDSNQDGVLTKPEIENSKDKFLAEVAGGLFQVADTNFDGQITLYEFLSVVDSAAAVEQSKNAGIAQSLMVGMDTNGDKKASKDEVRAFANRFNQVSESELGTVFLLLDSDKDGFLSITELQKLPEKITELAGIRPMPVIQN